MSASPQIAGWSEGLAQHAGVFFQAARLFLLTLIITLPLAEVTAFREISVIGASVCLLCYFGLRREFPRRPTALAWPLAALVLVAALSLLTAVDFSYSLKEFRGELLKGVLVFFTGVYFIQDEEHLSQAWAALVAGAVLMGAAGIYFFFADGGSLAGHQEMRAASLHYGYQAFGTYLVTVWPFLLLGLRQAQSRKVRAVVGAALALCFFSAYLTYSRAVWCSVLVESCLVAVLLTVHRKRAAAVALGAGLVLLGLLTLLPGSRHGETWSKAWHNPESMGGTGGDLVQVWSFALGKIEEHPFRGIGLGRHSFSKAFPEFRATHQPLLWHAHNTFLDLALQLGVQGLVVALWMLGVFLWELWPQAPPERRQVWAGYTTAALVMVVGFTVRNLTDDFFTDDSALMFYLLTGLALGGKCLAKERKLV
ncbi:MAG: O-antigen ligase family protein [Deltaproteobacteria bacterium]|nr:O-antigen ligase family protein [Deltaproteobacteria bacterium]